MQIGRRVLFIQIELDIALQLTRAMLSTIPVLQQSERRLPSPGHSGVSGKVLRVFWEGKDRRPDYACFLYFAQHHSPCFAFKTMAPGASIEMVNASRTANGFAPVDGFSVVNQRKKQINGKSSTSESDGDDSELDFDTEIAGHHAMSKRMPMPLAPGVGNGLTHVCHGQVLLILKLTAHWYMQACSVFLYEQRSDPTLLYPTLVVQKKPRPFTLYIAKNHTG